MTMAWSISIPIPIQTLLSSASKLPSSFSLEVSNAKNRKSPRICRGVVQQYAQGPSAAFAKEMERLSAKESLLLAFRDSGGFGSLVTGKTTDLQRLDVNERISGLERLNPTPRPTTSPYLEGLWNFEWFGSGSSGLSAARFLFERFPVELANLSKVDVVIKDGYTKVAASLKLLNSIESKFTISSKLSVEGPLRMKEEYIEGFIESPKVKEESIPQQLRGALNQALSTAQQLPVPIRDVLTGGMRVPLGGPLERWFFITYLDDEILVIRDCGGVPEVLTRLDPGPSLVAEPVDEYQS